uniref:Uncharacterized protein n=1 Tax=Aegilops tauschii subsp. strangulata TaxID=200361 RepID=A0A453HZT0_AEGTS
GLVPPLREQSGGPHGAAMGWHPARQAAPKQGMQRCWPLLSPRRCCPASSLPPRPCSPLTSPSASLHKWCRHVQINLSVGKTQHVHVTCLRKFHLEAIFDHDLCS